MILASAILGNMSPATAGTLSLSKKLTNSFPEDSAKTRQIQVERLQASLNSGKKVSLNQKIAIISTDRENTAKKLVTVRHQTKKLVEKLKASQTPPVETEVLSLLQRLKVKPDTEKNTSVPIVPGDKINTIQATVNSTNLVEKIKGDRISFTDTNERQESRALISSGEDIIEELKTQSTPAIIISQTDSSGVVGDTFGEINKLRQQLLIEPIDPIIVRPKPPVASPSSTAGTPTGYGVGSRQAYIGGGLSFPFDSDRDRTDGSFSFGFGEGDPINSLGVEFNFNITSVGSGSTFDFGDSGTIGFKLHRVVSRGTAVAFGWSNPIRWGDSDRSRPTLYGVITKAIPLQPNNPNHKFPLTVSVGVGSGAFRSKGALEDGTDTPNLFGSVGLQVIPQASLIGSWTGNRLNLGVSAVPVKSLPLVINAIYTDVTDNLNIGSGLSVVAGFGLRF